MPLGVSRSTRTGPIAPVGPLVGLVALFCLLSAFSLWWTLREADRLDTERARQSVETAIQGQLSQIMALAQDNAYSDDAAIEVARPAFNADFGRRTWGVGTEKGINYDAVAVLDPAGRTLFAIDRGVASKTDYRATFGEGLDHLMRQIDGPRTASATLIQTREGIHLVGLADIMAATPALRARLEPEGQYRLVLVRRLSNMLLADIGKGLQVKNLRLGPGREGSHSAPLSDEAGHAVGQVSWMPNRTGEQALWRAIPLLATVLALCMTIAGFLIRGRYLAHAELERQAMIDSLSLLPNRRALHRETRRWMDRHESVALALLDLDGFKSVNDNYGHEVGDHLIQECARLLLDVAGPEAMVARLGGDEFAILLHGQAAATRLEATAQSFLGRLEQPFRMGERTVVVGASIGLAVTEVHNSDAGELVRRADIAMYAAKQAGKMRFVWFDEELDRRQAEAHRIERELREALDRGELTTVYQPLVDAAGNGPIAVEALVRWTSPTRGPIGPSEFIPVAEETGLIDRVGMFVLRRACTDALAWPDIKLSINVSAAQLRNPDFASHVAAILEEIGFPPERLELEITETGLIVDPKAAARALGEIQALGIQVALDDFGTGYASIGFLRQFKFEKLKIDRSLVTDSEHSDASRILLQASVAVARGLNMAVVAEGVETDAQADLMRIAGCDQMQGWRYSHAISAAELDALVRSQERPGPKTGRAA